MTIGQYKILQKVKVKQNYTLIMIENGKETEYLSEQKFERSYCWKQKDIIRTYVERRRINSIKSINAMIFL
jgi:hypothetical protein